MALISVRISWAPNPPIQSIGSYRIYRKSTSGLALRAEVPGTTTQAEVTIDDDFPHVFVVTANTRFGESEPSEAVQLTPAPVTAPVGITMVRI